MFNISSQQIFYVQTPNMHQLISAMLIDSASGTPLDNPINELSIPNINEFVNKHCKLWIMEFYKNWMVG